MNLTLCLYEAVFEAALWEQFSATLHDDETDLLWEYITGQTIDVRDRQHQGSVEEVARLLEGLEVW